MDRVNPVDGMETSVETARHPSDRVRRNAWHDCAFASTIAAEVDFDVSALNGYRILELSEGVAGEFCGKLLADFGAEVIKIERPGSGSPTRHLGPFGKGGDANERSGLYAYLNTNKRSVVLDLETPAGTETLRKLAGKVDVIVDDHASGWLASVGLDPRDAERDLPALALCSITPFGQNPPDDRKHAEDLTVFHSSGWGYHTPGVGFEDRPPLKGPGRFFAHYEAAQEAAMTIAGCLFDRERTGKGASSTCRCTK